MAASVWESGKVLISLATNVSFVQGIYQVWDNLVQ